MKPFQSHSTSNLTSLGSLSSKRQSISRTKTLLGFVFSVLVLAGFGFKFAYGARQFLPVEIDGNLFMPAGLVGVTAGCMVLDIGGAAIVGLAGGIVVVLANGCLRTHSE